MVDVTADQVRATLQLHSERKTAYGLCFVKGAASSIALEDLNKFCRGDMPTFHADARQHARLEGRREVWLRIQQYLHLSPEELLNLYAGSDVRIVINEDKDNG